MIKPNFNYDTSYTQNRELSWLRFNERVLQEGCDCTVPLLERLKFISIFISNLDEFFMIRVGSLFDLTHIKKETYDNKTGDTPKQQLEKVFSAVEPLYKSKDEAFFRLEQELRHREIFNLGMSELTNSELKFVENYFKKNVMPLLSPQIIDSHHPFPHLWNKALYAIGNVQYKESSSTIGILGVPKALPKILILPSNKLRYILMEKIILYYFESVFDLYSVSNKCIISVTRNADISPEDEAFDFDEDFRSQMKQILKKRSRLSPVRLEVQGNLEKKLGKYLMNKLNIDEVQIFASKSPLVMDYAFVLEDNLSVPAKRSLLYTHFEPQYPSTLNRSISVKNQIIKRDVLVFYPYESIEPFIQLLKESSTDKMVKSIKITLYRLASKSKVIEYLCEAAENGKDVTVMIELRARFDEKNNIEWAERLEESGCKVIYGFEEYKVHSKICLITCMDKDKISYITQIGTGNYNEKTAKLYTDLSLMTADPEIGKDAANFFKNMLIGNLDGIYFKLLVAPSSYKCKMMELIDEEIEKSKRGMNGRLIFKANSLTERDIIDKLAEASIAGVKVDLIIRGICCILPEIKGKTENIRVTSIVGRFLEHPRIYCFGSGNDAKIYISSADLMTRNMDRRVELACPILDDDNKRKIIHILDVMLKDNKKARIMRSDGTYVKKEGSKNSPFNSQKFFIRETMLSNIKIKQERPGKIFKTKLLKIAFNGITKIISKL
ncbi:polyphosphate kinase 1 [Alkalibacter mobilis]|uniref:polyphosphate kinase 1 n=1 Tax=Alkalibacter mobilis TaxID=2787712 RepID=UPI0018A00845|nr:polyphosphate kinase 1 [Alkalibacter mobilis]MBF7097754.1 polyphosphate kinase 1 [Alkalibacter mobilis]